MNKELQEANKQKRIKKLAEEFMCAILSDGKWYECHTQEPRAIVEKALRCAQKFYDIVDCGKL